MTNRNIFHPYGCFQIPMHYIMKYRFKNWFEIFGFWKSFFILSINLSMTLKCTMFFIFEGKEIKIIRVQSSSGIVPKRQISLTMLFVLLGCLLMLAGWLTSISKEFSLGWFESKFNRFSFEEMRGKRCISKFSNASLYWCHASGQAASPILV